MSQRFTVDDARFKGDTENGRKVDFLDVTKRQGEFGGIPVKPIPFMEFPMAVYRHPLKPYREIVHRNARFEVVGIEHVQAEHLVRMANSQAELDALLAKGWTKTPYIPVPLPDPNEDLYGLAGDELPTADVPSGYTGPTTTADNGVRAASQEELAATHGAIASRGRKHSN